MQSHIQRTRKLLVVAVAAALGGCAVTPHPLTADEQKAMLQADQRAMFADQDPVSGPITLDEAMARALKYNLDQRVKVMEQALAHHQLDLSNFDLLPKLTAAAGYTHRSNVLASSSQDVVTGQQSLAPSTSSDRTLRRADLAFSWNVLDFGVSYYTARQNADQVLAAGERRRKVVQMLMQQVRLAYWQALGAQRLEQKIEPLLQQIHQALDDSRTIEKEQLKSPLTALSYQRELLDLVLRLQSIRDELRQAKPRLAALMNIEPGQSFELSAPANFVEPKLDIAPANMEQIALLHRPEVIEADYKERISVAETHKAIAKLFPGIELSLGGHYDSNSYVVNDKWSDAGFQISWNILNLFNAHNVRAAAKAQRELAREQRLALNMAVLTQVHVAWLDYNSRTEQFQLTQRLNDVEQRILQHTRNATASSAEGRLAEIRAAASALMTELRRYQSYAALQGAYGQMLASLGLDPVPAAVASHDLHALETAIRNTEQQWQSPVVPEPVVPEAVPKAIPETAPKAAASSGGAGVGML